MISLHTLSCMRSGTAFGLLDTYIRPHLTLEELRVSRGGLARTIGHHPASIMAGWNVPRPVGSAVSQDDANGIVWLYKFYHENLPLEDCIFPDYELEKDRQMGVALSLR